MLVICLYRLVPTRVGMILFFPRFSEPKYACPHTRGDDPNNERLTFFGITLSPHAWG